MKICFMCDLHLPFDKNALQYDVLRWAIADAARKGADVIAFAGDITCDGNEAVYEAAVSMVEAAGTPFLYIPGNSDLRCPESRSRLMQRASAGCTEISGVRILAVKDADGTISDEQMAMLEEARATDVVFMHHPPKDHTQPTREWLLAWREKHPETALFYGHLHRSYDEGCTFSLGAMDPDKSIGESPSVAYYDTESKTVRRAFYFSPVPTDLYEYLGVSCYDTLGQIELAIRHGLRALELRPNAVRVDAEALREAIGSWRASGGENLSIHLPDIGAEGRLVMAHPDLGALVALVDTLGADRVTQHVPTVSVEQVRCDPEILERIGAYLAEQLSTVSHPIVIGVENMHMTARERADDTRRFGYIPEECLEFAEVISRYTSHRVGINFDVGHARNNAPFSQKYQIGTWLSMLGNRIVGYHVHQVTYEDGVFENHMPITDVYGHLISYASFFDFWREGRISKAPIVLEMRPEGAYETTLATFARHRERRVFDLHSHTHYSFCGKDDPRELIEVARKNGLSLFGICDHNYGIGERKRSYLLEMRALAEEYRDRIRLLCGIEIATLPHLYDLKSPKEIEGYDYCLIEHISSEDSIVGKDLFAFCADLGILCGIAHTDLFAYCDAMGFEYRSFFTRMAECKIFWEMNVSYDSIHGYREHAYVLDFMQDEQKQRIIRECGVYVSVGFDSHRCCEYDGDKVYKMYDFLKEKGILTADALLVPSGE